MAESSADVRAMMNDFLRAVESLELERITPFFEEDAQMFSPLGTYAARLDGRPAIMAQFKAIAEFARAMPTPLKIEPKELVVREFGDIALATFHLTLPGPLHRRTFVLHRSGGRWRIAHIHASVASPVA
ncbi:MAG TPA: nuclear transport factor 2 family protein [Candidatus Acidoferrales bacterium]|nr:nuclear transport factor 2 family protein [Candidatus Acidoferrales bacterium]